MTILQHNFIIITVSSWLEVISYRTTSERSYCSNCYRRSSTCESCFFCHIPCSMTVLLPCTCCCTSCITSRTCLLRYSSSWNFSIHESAYLLNEIIFQFSLSVLRRNSLCNRIPSCMQFHTTMRARSRGKFHVYSHCISISR